MNNYTYQEAFEELQQIVADIESGNISVDQLLEKVTKASELIKVCRTKLVSTEENVHKILATMEQPSASEEPGEGTDVVEESDEDDFPF